MGDNARPSPTSIGVSAVTLYFILTLPGVLARLGPCLFSGGGLLGLDRGRFAAFGLRRLRSSDHIQFSFSGQCRDLDLTRRFGPFGFISRGSGRLAGG